VSERAQTQPTFMVSGVEPSVVGLGLVELSIRLDHVDGPLTERHMAVLYRALVERLPVYIVIPDHVPRELTKPKRRRRR